MAVSEWSERFLTFDIMPRSLRVNFLINRIEGKGLRVLAY